jgi:hypothetical protein
VGFSKQGVALLLSIVLGGILVLIGIFAIHGFILLRLHKQTWGVGGCSPACGCEFSGLKKENIA